MSFPQAGTKCLFPKREQNVSTMGSDTFMI
jgi:hypothetical protein